MPDVSSAPARTRGSAVKAIFIGGIAAGVIDLLQACIFFGWDIPLAIAAGVLGKPAFQGGAGTYVLGVLLHFFIAISAAGIYYAACRSLPFLAVNWVVCGLFFGMAVELVMRLVVLPLSALHSRGPYQLRSLILGLVAHMVVVGLPISLSCRLFGRPSTLPGPRADSERSSSLG